MDWRSCGLGVFTVPSIPTLGGEEDGLFCSTNGLGGTRTGGEESRGDGRDLRTDSRRRRRELPSGLSAGRLCRMPGCDLRSDAVTWTRRPATDRGSLLVLVFSFSSSGLSFCSCVVVLILLRLLVHVGKTKDVRLNETHKYKIVTFRALCEFEN